MKASANPVFVQFSNTIAPEAWESKQAKRIYEAGIAAEKNGEDVAHALRGSVTIEPKQDESSMMCPCGTSAEAARKIVEAKITKLRCEADEAERMLKLYGVSPFIAQPQAISAPIHPFEVEPFLIGLIRKPIKAITVHGHRFEKDRSGAFVEVEHKI
jgi:hypothetical protein